VNEKKKASQRAWVEANREHVRAYNREYLRKWRAQNPERERAKVRAWRAANLDKCRKLAAGYERKRRLGISPAEYDAMALAQGGRCAICGTDKPGGQGGFHVDHSHAFPPRDPHGRRGLLCHHCNTALGLMRDDPALLRAAAAYVEHHAVRTAATVAA
jgi:hypothetical protein